ncbi:formylglycine-generating enzyme family protein [Candidatus Riflebacteria bacterium]
MHICPKCDFTNSKPGTCPEHKIPLETIPGTAAAGADIDSKLLGLVGKNINNIQVLDCYEKSSCYFLFQAKDEFTQEIFSLLVFKTFIEDQHELFKKELSLITRLSRDYPDSIAPIQSGGIFSELPYILIRGFPYFSMKTSFEGHDSSYSEAEVIEKIVLLMETVKKIHMFKDEIMGQAISRITLGDLFPENLYLDSENNQFLIGIAPLMDMTGSFRPFKQKVFKEKFNKDFTPPELTGSSPIPGPWVDAWQLGRLMAYMLGLKDSLNITDLDHWPFENMLLKGVITGLLEPEIESRLTIGKALDILQKKRPEIVETHKVIETVSEEISEATLPKKGLPHDTYTCKRTGITFYLITGGEFYMGTQNKYKDGNNYEKDGCSDESPVHRQKIESFFMAEHPVTNAQYSIFLKITGGKHGEWCHKSCPKNNIVNHRLKVDKKFLFCHPDQPVVGVCWWDAYAFCKWLGYRLPNEAEWEYAALGGSFHFVYPWGEHFEEGKMHADNNWVIGHPRKVGSFARNSFSLYDMSGNTWEWMDNEYSTYNQNTGLIQFKGLGEPALRGGSWGSPIKSCRIRYRYHSFADYGNYGTGFRIAKNISGEKG